MGVSSLTPGTTRILGSAALKYFNDGGAFGSADVLSCGWFGSFRTMAETYSGPASPYWTSKGFLGLLLPAGHPVWTATEKGGPVVAADSVRLLPAPGFLLSSTAADGVVRLANHGSDNHPGIMPGDDPHYSRLAYPTRTAPEYCAPLDNHIAVLDVFNAPSRRTAIHRRDRTTPDTLASAHRPVWGDAGFETDSPWLITSATAIRGPWELRLHVVESGTDQTARIREGGCAAAAGGDVSTFLIPVLGYTESGVENVAGSNPMAPATTIPWLSGVHGGTRSVFASLAVLTGDTAAVTWLASAALNPELSELDGVVTVTITAPDGAALSAGVII